MEKIFDVVIIGSGPAGLTAALYASRAGLTTIMIENDAPGGKMVKTSEIENWPGDNHITGPELAMRMFEHATRFGAVWHSGKVVDILHGNPNSVHLEDDQIIKGHTVFIATGTKERLLNIPGEQKYTNRGISYCAVCDGAFFKDKIVTIIGGGNSALEEALFLTTFAKQVNIIIRRDVFRAEKHIQERIEKNHKINVIKSKIPVEILGDDLKVTGIKIKDVKTNEESIIETSGIFPFIGLDPVTSFCSRLDILNEQGYIKVNTKMETSIPGIFAIGDVTAKDLRQIVTAAGDGAIAAQQALHYIDNIKDK